MLMMIQPFLFFCGVGAVIGTLAWVVLSIIGFIVGLYRAIKAPRNPHPVEITERFASLDALLRKFSVKERIAKFFRFMPLVVALVVSLDIILFAIIFFKDDSVILRLGIFASILLAIYSCKKLYPQI